MLPQIFLPSSHSHLFIGTYTHRCVGFTKTVLIPTVFATFASKSRVSPKFASKSRIFSTFAYKSRVFTVVCSVQRLFSQSVYFCTASQWRRETESKDQKMVTTQQSCRVMARPRGMLVLQKVPRTRPQKVRNHASTLTLITRSVIDTSHRLSCFFFTVCSLSHEQGHTHPQGK